MHSVSNTWTALYNGIHTVHTVAEIETVSIGTTQYVELGDDKLYSVKVTGSLFPDREPSIGNFVSREVDLVIEPPQNTIPRTARIRLFVYLQNGNTVSERISKGVFWIDTREYTQDKGKMLIHGYDAAMKFESDFDSSKLFWPSYAINIVNELASSVGVAVDSRTQTYMNQFINYKIPLQTNVTKRDMLKGIAAQYCGNWTITDEGKLLLIGINTGSDDIHLSYLIDENDNRLKCGDDRLIIGINEESDDIELSYFADENGNRLKYGSDRLIVGY